MTRIVTLNESSEPIQYLCAKDKRLAKVIEMVGPITYEPHDGDPYAFLVHEIIEQMLSIKAGAKIYERLEDLCGGHVAVDAVNVLTDMQIRGTGVSSRKVSYIRDLVFCKPKIPTFAK